MAKANFRAGKAVTTKRKKQLAIDKILLILNIILSTGCLLKLYEVI